METSEFAHWTNEAVTKRLEELVPFPVRMARGWRMDRQPILIAPPELKEGEKGTNPVCISHFHHLGDGHLLDLWVDCVTMKVVDWRYTPSRPVLG